MTDPDRLWNLPEYYAEKPAILRDGNRVWIRPVHATDHARLTEFLDHVSDESLEYRFFTPARRDVVVDEMLRAPPNGHRLALIAIDHESEGEIVVAHAEFLEDPYEPLTAEVAFLLRDSWRGRGLGTILLHRLAAAARSRGLRRFYAYVLPSNDGMLEVFRNCGFPEVESTSEGITRVEIPIAEPPTWLPEEHTSAVSAT